MLEFIEEALDEVAFAVEREIAKPRAAKVQRRTCGTGRWLVSPAGAALFPRATVRLPIAADARDRRPRDRAIKIFRARFRQVVRDGPRNSACCPAPRGASIRSSRTHA